MKNFLICYRQANLTNSILFFNYFYQMYFVVGKNIYNDGSEIIKDFRNEN